jgi:hypothetical protein
MDLFITNSSLQERQKQHQSRRYTPSPIHSAFNVSGNPIWPNKCKTDRGLILIFQPNNERFTSGQMGGDVLAFKIIRAEKPDQANKIKTRVNTRKESLDRETLTGLFDGQ